ncbi:hypothetical protein HYH03_014654 [Edaphochlamys debaryana]|uniref:Uncharacterized protein n=1 Tax=Edaphochlamys debaryana TaxID=47281 RepID=A0A835XNQ7_9CHLO|nr:hypothetical protein HYH03_014654 [Edaphochlamys debaryana]|eukprot:KAG2486727.1 hypothetical protein HYH03_014654 [Edaphochlamys debaryana]
MGCGASANKGPRPLTKEEEELIKRQQAAAAAAERKRLEQIAAVEAEKKKAEEEAMAEIERKQREEQAHFERQKGLAEEAKAALLVDKALHCSFPDELPFSSLPECIRDLHERMPAEFRKAPVRLINIDSVISWHRLMGCEELPTSHYMAIPYEEVNETQWSQTAVLSWRWGATKPKMRQPGFTPMLEWQIQELRTVLHRLKEVDIKWIWIDWCSIPQYSLNMIEVYRSKVYYARARAMVVIPSYTKLPDQSTVQLMIQKTQEALAAKAQSVASPDAMAATCLSAMLDKGAVAGRKYFGRTWTKVERMARYGRHELLSHWMSLEAWLGMMVDAMLRGVEDRDAAHAAAIEYRSVLGEDIGGLLVEVVDSLVAASKSSDSVAACEGLEQTMGTLFEAGVRIWQSQGDMSGPPSFEFLLSYLETIPDDVYTTSTPYDVIWAMWSYFSWKKQALHSEVSVSEAVKDLVQMAGGSELLLTTLATKLKLPKVTAEGTKNMGPPLREAAERGDLAGVKEMLAAGAWTEAPDQDGATALWLAARGGHCEVAAALLEGGARADAAAKDGSTPLLVAARAGQLELARQLMAAKARTDAAAKDGSTPLLAAAAAGHVGVMQAMLGDASREDKGRALWAAADAGQVPAVRALLAAGVYTETIKHEVTPLWSACHQGHTEVAEALIRASAFRELVGPEGLRPLHVAAREGHIAIVRALLAAGAQVDAILKDGRSALHLAAEADQRECVQALLEAGADPRRVDKWDRTPSQRAPPDSEVEALIRDWEPTAPADQDPDAGPPLLTLEQDADGLTAPPPQHLPSPQSHPHPHPARAPKRNTSVIGADLGDEDDPEIAALARSLLVPDEPEPDPELHPELLRDLEDLAPPKPRVGSAHPIGAYVGR